MKSSGSAYGLTRRKDSNGEVGGEAGEGSRSFHSDSNVKKMCEKWTRPAVYGRVSLASGGMAKGMRDVMSLLSWACRALITVSNYNT